MSGHPLVQRFIIAALAASSWVLVRPAPGMAEMWQDQDQRTQNTGFPLYATRIQDDEIRLSRQELSPNLTLTGPEEHLLGKYGITVLDVLRELAPHLENATPRLTSVTANGDSVHEHWEFSYRDYPLHRMYVRLHFNRNQLTMLQAALPAYRLVASEVDAFTFGKPEDLGYGKQPGEDQVAHKVLANAGGMLAPAWHIVTRKTETDGISELLIDAQSGSILAASSNGMFPLTQPARVYAVGPGDGRITEVGLTGLSGDGWLNGRYFAIYAPDKQSPRVAATGDELAFDPASAADAVSFDQVQAYYTAMRGMRWFHEQLGVEMPFTAIPIRVNDLIRGKPDNAIYVEPPFGPEIKIGRGSNTIQNLARESDVLLHELAHHVIYQFVTNKEGESGILHEGFADYFAYAINGDPYLGESVVAGRSYLRTGRLGPDERYDSLSQESGKHLAGQIWSAVLWQIHEETAGGAARLIYNALPYAGPAPGFRDALLALLNADRDLHPLPADDPDFGIYGQQKCIIISAAVARGFATFIENLDASSCNLNLTLLAQESREQNRVQTRGSGASVELFGRKCSALPADRGAAVPTGWGLLLLIFPLVISVFRTHRPQE